MQLHAAVDYSPGSGAPLSRELNQGYLERGRKASVLS